jgi:hypothetical protein
VKRFYSTKLCVLIVASCITSSCSSSGGGPLLTDAPPGGGGGGCGSPAQVAGHWVGSADSLTPLDATFTEVGSAVAGSVKVGDPNVGPLWVGNIDSGPICGNAITITLSGQAQSSPCSAVMTFTRSANSISGTYGNSGATGACALKSSGTIALVLK